MQIVPIECFCLLFCCLSCSVGAGAHVLGLDFVELASIGERCGTQLHVRSVMHDVTAPFVTATIPLDVLFYAFLSALPHAVVLL